ncbi:MAG: hypothetical protein FD165_2905, partial [Gammaproteobacteria bacterium]
SLENSFYQDLNHDGVIGINIPTTVIESFGSTSLARVGNNFYLNSNSTGSGPQLTYGGSAVVAGQFGACELIGAEATATGYVVAWQVAGADLYAVWNIDSSGNYLNNATGGVSGTSAALQSQENSFSQDLNRDGATGINITTTAIESFGSTSLARVGNDFYLNSNSTGSGPQLTYGGSAVVAGQFGTCTLIGAEATATGYVVAWQVAGADQYAVWNTDSGGNYLSNATGGVSGSSTALQSLENSFYQDLNHDGVIGINIPTTVIESFGSTSLRP